MDRVIRGLIIALCGVWGAFAVAAPLSAHASLMSANPTDKQVLMAEPSTVTMTFTENLVPSPGSFIYVSTAGNDASAGASAISASDTKTMTLPLKPGLGNGTYGVFWKSTSADDGGVTFGRMTFFVGTPAASDVAVVPAAASVAVPDEATDMAVSPGGMASVKLAAGCNMVALTFDDNTPAATVAAAVTPTGTVTISRYDPTAGRYLSYSTAGGTNDLKTVNHLDAVWLCTSGAATLMQPNA
jgi:methionine-rich copper-binding protein CopC